ncbi:MAG: DUF4982 domain-containing protein [Puniceicoccales bacterium]|jgi:beta-galactosidase|nr:DUF4982 domain-containing protein [Puniceicoccales bacterium]
MLTLPSFRHTFFSLLAGTLLLALPGCSSPLGKDNDRREISLNQGWKFSIENKATPESDPDEAQASFDDSTWEKVNLPHTPRLDSPNVGDKYFKGICWYRQQIPVNPEWKGKQVSIVFDGAMQKTDVWVNGKFVTTHLGGYLPFVIPLNPHLDGADSINIALRLDNNGNPLFPPGNNRVDFIYAGGLYRPARLVVTNDVHITHPIEANLEASGGIFVRTEKLEPGLATLFAQTHVRNDGTTTAKVSVEHILLNRNMEEEIARSESQEIDLPAGQGHAFAGSLQVQNPRLWHPDHPHLYTLVSRVKSNGTVRDIQNFKCGIRWMEVNEKGFHLNGEKIVLRGANRHMSYPWLGNAASDNLQYRDIRLLKEAGFNFVRLAHYPQSESTMRACDELGVMALVCTPGWQFFAKNESFSKQGKQNIREMVRWQRNHPSAVLWEVSLNETYGHDDYYAECSDIARAEYPGSQMLTSGDSHATKRVDFYDIPYSEWKGFYNRPPHPTARYKQAFHREYGDYEFGGQRSTTRVRRGADEDSLMRQAWNFQWAHNKNLSWAWTSGDAIWAGIDTASTFDKLDENGAGLGSFWGPLDLYRLPKFSYYFYQSQRSPDVKDPRFDSGPMVRIAGYWTERPSPAKVVVYSNCDEVALVLNGKEIARQKPDSGADTDYGAYRLEADPMYWINKDQDSFAATKAAEEKGSKSPSTIFDGGNCRQLEHPPFTFIPVPYEKGELKAVAYRNGKIAAEHSLRTPGKSVSLRLRAPKLGKQLAPDGADALFIYADLLDENGTVVPENGRKVTFKITRGDARLVIPAESTVEAGIAPMILQAGTTAGKITVTAESEGIKSAKTEIPSFGFEI